MAVTIDGTTGVSLVQDGVITKANLPTGTILQSLTSTLLQNPDQVDSSSTSYADTGHSVTITPTSTSSTIYIHLLTTVAVPNNLNQAARIKLFRDSTEIFYSNNIFYTTSSAQEFLGAGYCFGKVDSPSSTSAITYKTQFAMRESGSTGTYNSQDAVLLVMEIAG